MATSIVFISKAGVSPITSASSHRPRPSLLPPALFTNVRLSVMEVSAADHCARD